MICSSWNSNDGCRFFIRLAATRRQYCLLLPKLAFPELTNEMQQMHETQHENNTHASAACCSFVVGENFSATQMRCRCHCHCCCCDQMISTSFPHSKHSPLLVRPPRNLRTQQACASVTAGHSDGGSSGPPRGAKHWPHAAAASNKQQAGGRATF